MMNQGKNVAEMLLTMLKTVGIATAIFVRAVVLLLCGAIIFLIASLLFFTESLKVR